MYEAFSKRKLVESLERRKLAIIAGMHGNMNFSGKDLSKAVDDIEGNFQQAIATIYGKPKEKEEPLEANPFFAAMKLPKVDVTEEDRQKLAPVGIEAEIEIDQS